MIPWLSECGKMGLNLMFSVICFAKTKCFHVCKVLVQFR